MYVREKPEACEWWMCSKTGHESYILKMTGRSLGRGSQQENFPAEGTAVPKARRQEFDSPRYLGVASQGSRAEMEELTLERERQQPEHRAVQAVLSLHFYLLSHEDQLKYFNQKSEMIRFSFYTITLWAVQGMVWREAGNLVEFKPEIIKTRF